jgi:hypothetical protein
VAPDETKKVYGDGTVLSTSALVAGIKWADDYKRGVSGAKPVNFVEVCSIYKRRTSVFTPGTLTVNSSAYFGIDCDCGGSRFMPRDGKKCGHTLFVTDYKVIDFLLKSAMDGVKAVESTGTKNFFEKSENQLSAYEDTCQLLNAN